ncbi:MAG TPA: histidine kinase dimerization/phospho-acceptor domain-containing protein [Myxococcota bacterium]|nr:histidine kinase dimerization/phospho-acceptor domain-containing protein [Myxococcota bacterium]
MARMILLQPSASDDSAVALLRDRGYDVERVDGGEVRRVLAHDLRNPLGVILGNAELVKEGVYGELTPKQEAALATIERQAERLADMLEVLVDRLRIEGGSG